jgi:protease-4
MAKFLLGVIVGVVIVVLGGLILILALGRLFSTKQPVVPPNAVLVLALEGTIPERAPVEISLPFVQVPGSPTIRDLWTSLRAAAKDNRVKAVVLEPRGLDAGWGKLAELRSDLLDFKKSGKPVYALLEGAGSKEYYLATAADRIFISPDDYLNVKGFRIQELYFKNALEKLGIGVQVDHIGRYKDAGDLFTRTNMTPETREVLNGVLDQIYNDFCATVSGSRHKTPEDVKALVDMGPFLAEQAKAVGLADDLGYEDQVFTAVKKKTGLSSLNKFVMRSYARATPGRGDRIALLVGEGDILRGEAGGAGSDAVIASEPFSKLVRQVREDTSVKGVVVRIDSPGGDAVASDEILHELKLLSAAKPTVISMSDVAASGGYFMSMTGDPIFSYPDTITGSIGVLYVRPNFKGLLEKFGISQDSLSRGKLADIDSLSTPLSDAGFQKLHDAIQATYHSFVSKVAAARKKSYEQIDPLAQGRVWMGSQAYRNGLVDKLGGLNEAIAAVRKRAHLSETGDTNLVMYPPRRSLLQAIAESQNEAQAEAALWKRIRERVQIWPGPAALKGGLLALMPYSLSVQ